MKFDVERFIVTIYSDFTPEVIKINLLEHNDNIYIASITVQQQQNI